MFGIKTRAKNSVSKAKWQLSNYKAHLNQSKNINDYIKNHKTRKLNLGCWPYVMDSWLNTDINGNNDVVPLDLTKKFPIMDATFHYIFCEHTIEHFDLYQGLEILKNCYRILMPGGKVRFATPDLNFLINLYNIKKSKIQKNYIHWASTEFLDNFGLENDTVVINNFVRAWGHQFIYDYKTLKLQLEKVGFISVTRFKPGVSPDKNLTNLEMHWKSIGNKEFNNLETFVVEAIKPK